MEGGGMCDEAKNLDVIRLHPPEESHTSKILGADSSPRQGHCRFVEEE
jgi:hypothetical protein